MTEETPQQAARYTSFGHDFQKLVAASSGVSNPVFEMKLNLPDSFDSEIKKIIKANFPRKCNKCGFSKFFTIKITSLSMGDSFIAECPKCEEEVKDFSEYEDKKVGK